MNGPFFLETFAAHDRSHPLSNAIDLELEQVTKKLIDHGHVFDRSWITRALENDETVQSVLCGHSERLAIGFNLIQRPIPRRIQIVEDLRICGDCR